MENPDRVGSLSVYKHLIRSQDWSTTFDHDIPFWYWHARTPEKRLFDSPQRFPTRTFWHARWDRVNNVFSNITIGKTANNPYARTYSHCLRHSSSSFRLHTAAACRNLSSEEVHKRFGLHSLSTEVMPGDEDLTVPSPDNSESLDKRFDEALERFEAVMTVRMDEFQQARQRISKEASTTLQVLKAFKPEEHQRQINTIFNKLGEHADVNKRTQEQLTKTALDVIDIRK